MSDIRLAITDRAVAKLELTTSGQYFVRDTEVVGFMVLVGKRRKTFVVQGDRKKRGRRLSVRMKIAEVGEIPARKARAKAKDILGKIATGFDPRELSQRRPAKRSLTDIDAISDPTLRDAWERYRNGHLEKKGRSSKTIEGYRDHVERLLADWLDDPLSSLGRSPARVILRHEKLTTDHGPYIANGCMRTLRAIYNHARKAARTLPAENPVSAVDWNGEHRRDTALGQADLQAWLQQLAALKSPLRREFHLFLLLSGHRPEAIKEARLVHLDFRQRLLHVPRPKGGAVKAFDIPLSRPMIRCLVRVLRIGRALYPEQSLIWIFPAGSKSGHLTEHKEDRAELSKWGNDLRQTYRTIAQAAGIPELDVHLLMNHSIPGVNAGYITRNKLLSDHLRKQQEAISGQIMAAANAGTKRSASGKWPFVTSRKVLTSTKA